MHKKHCNNNKYDPYESLAEAEDKCTNDGNCRGVYDSGCENRGDFYLCEVGSYEFGDSTDSCVYEKNYGITSGLFLLVFSYIRSMIMYKVLNNMSFSIMQMRHPQILHLAMSIQIVRNLTIYVGKDHANWVRQIYCPYDISYVFH